jgi:hypothetical protein
MLAVVRSSPTVLGALVPPQIRASAIESAPLPSPPALAVEDEPPKKKRRKKKMKGTPVGGGGSGGSMNDEERTSWPPTRLLGSGGGTNSSEGMTYAKAKRLAFGYTDAKAEATGKVGAWRAHNGSHDTFV